MLETYMKLCMTGPDFPEKTFLPQKLGRWPKMGQKQVFLNLMKILVISFYCICSIMMMQTHLN